jgi:DNA-binding response OmpR family regulator
VVETQRRSVLLITDDESIRSELPALLSSHGFDVHAVASTEAGLESARSLHPDLVIADVHGIEPQSRDLCKQLRSITLAPIIVLAERGETTDELLSFASGADDYVTKPFVPDVLLARLHAHLDRVAMDALPPSVITAANVRIDLDARAVLVNDRHLDLTKIEFGIMSHLARHLDHIVDRRTLIAAVWGPWFSDDHVIDVNLSRLRSKLTAAGAPPTLISTHRGLGIRLNP